MKTYVRKHRSGNKSTWIQLEPGETAVIIRNDCHYKLGGQVDDVVGSHVLQDAQEVSWCSVSQEWVPVRENITITPAKP